ncbi:ABC transporter permease [Quatrionicoccus australiensis]|uniref:ABC transporter permease n=1 Tax=Quatrionicoccus australiensis TaxID=138118 RepID=UPI001CFBF883|nr:ABC transporter permease [Quatrionicoccus australiensis]MCB4358862.1 ABC transporter permease [Quatrionicoccus australiensis]
MGFQVVVLWSDVLVWLLVAAGIGFGVLIARSPPLLAAWRRVGANRVGMAAATVLLVFIGIGLLDSLHYRVQLDGKPGEPVRYGIEVRSLLDALATPLRTRNEKTYSAPFATRLYAKESVDVPGQGSVRDYPRLKFGGAHLGANENDVAADAGFTALRAGVLALLLWLVLAGGVAARVGDGAAVDASGWRKIWRGETALAWDAVLATFGLILLAALPLFWLAGQYHVFGTDKVGQDVLYQILKSVRTGLIIGLVTTLVMLPMAVLLGIVAGYFRGWIDDLIQYVYTVLNSIPGVLLIAASVLMMQVVIDTHPQWFSTAAERADLRLLALCFILGITSWTGLCRLLRGETLKLRELEYIQAAQAFGVSNWRIIVRHILPNLMHIVIISLVMDFSGLVLAEAVLSYVGIGVDPSMTSFGTMINNARLELGREPVVWWSLAAAFTAMFILVLAANLFADAVRDAFDPRAA